MPRTDGVPHLIARDPGIVSVVLDSLRSGATIAAAARFAGISPDSLRRWRTRGMELLVDYDGDPESGTEGEKMLMEIALELDRAIAGLEIATIGTIVRAYKGGDWRAAAWMAEHHPEMKASFSNRSEVIQASVQGSAKKALEGAQSVTDVLASLSSKLAALESGEPVEDVIDAEVIEEN